MGLGNGNSKSGNKGSNFNYEFRSIAILGEISNILSGAVPAPPGGLASETTLQAVLSAIDTMRDYEVRLVVDSDDPAVTWLEVRYWDAQTGALGAPQYYLPGSTTPGTPVAPISYVNQQTLLNQILSELQAQTTRLISLDGKDFSTETTLAALNAKLNSLGQKGSGESAPVVLSTEQEVILDAIKTAVQNIDTDLGTGGLSQESTQLLVKAVLDAIKLDTAAILTNTADIEALLTTIDADTSNLDVALSTRATEATLLLVKGVLDNIKLDTAAIDANTDGLEALLTTIDTVLDAIKLDTANLDVALSTRATEATLLSVLSELQAINIDTNGLSQEATQLLVKGVLDTIDAVLDTIKLDTGAMVIDLAAIEVLITTTNSLLTTIDGVLDNIKLDTAAMVTDLAAIETELLDQGTTLDAIAVDAAAIEAELLDQGTTLDAVQTATEGINTKLTSVTRTPSYTRVTGASSSSVAAGARSAAFANFGNTDATVLGSTLSPGASISFSAGGEEDVLGAIAYSTLAGNTELLITTIV